ncbi:MAG: chromate efflux transporter [Acidimicrobiales bacterium]|nr:chromate efflux transporter [Acidimicrobiales bacterium]MCB9395877.1 chromate efflux transporter [Acidimicrobiaceae bacterium]
MTDEHPAAPSARDRVGEVARVFVRLGVIGFGGPAAHIAMMRADVVRTRQWVDDAEFLELVGATNLVPGPNSTELAIHLGHRRAGARGLVVAGLCFILPAVAIVSVLAWLYERYGTDPAVIDLRYGILPVIIAIVVHALYGLGRTALTSAMPILVTAASLAAYLADVHELLILVVAGAVGATWHRWNERPPRVPRRRASVGLLGLPVFADPDRAPAAVSLWRLGLVFLEIGSVLYGSGYVLLAFMQRHLVDDLGWLTGQQLLDAIAVGQITPGPVFTTATFVGWQVDGPLGATIATVGIFAPSFVFVALLGRIVPWMRARPTAKAFLAGVTAASLGLMAGVLVQLVDVALVDPLTVVLAVAALVALVRTKLDAAWLVVIGVGIGVIHLVAS